MHKPFLRQHDTAPKLSKIIYVSGLGQVEKSELRVFLSLTPFSFQESPTHTNTLMKKLFIARHARTNQTAADDQNRSLSESGITDAREVAKKLTVKGVKLEKVFTSPIRRARATAEVMVESLHLLHKEIGTMTEDYHSSPEDFLRFVQQLDDQWSHVLIVNHNSPLTHFIELLTGATIELINPSCVAEVEFDINSWKEIKAGSGKLLGIEHPSFDHY